MSQLRLGVLANLALILAISGILLFFVFSASLERAALDVKTGEAAVLANLIESRISQATSKEQLWTGIRLLCRSEPAPRIRLYDDSGHMLGGCGPRSDLGPPDQSVPGHRIRIERSPWPSGLFRPTMVILDVTRPFPYGVRSVRVFLEISPSVFAPAWKFFGGYLVLTQVSLFFLGYILFHRTVIGPVSEIARLARKVSGLAEFPEFSMGTTPGGDIQRISTSLKAMIVRIGDDRAKMEALVEELTAANRELEAAQQGLIRSEKLAGVGRLAAGLAHEVGNPLQIVMGYVELLDKSPDRDTISDVIPRMEQELSRIHHILQSLLEFARPIRERVVSCDLNELVKDCASLVEGRKGFRKVEFEYVPDPNLPLFRTEPEKIRQVLINLIFNSVDSIPETGGKVCLRTRTCNDGVEIEIEDTGSGIPSEHIDKVYDPFFTTKEPGKGTGLGLAVCLSLIESLGGSIDMKSDPAQGTVVVVKIPS